MSELTKRIFDSVEKYVEKENRKYQPKRKNKAPEEEVVAELMAYFKENDWFIRRYEAKSKQINGVWRSAGLAPGTPDLMGWAPNGVGVACEVKAKGKNSTLRQKQRDFLVEVIKRNGFGVCSDSLQQFQRVWTRWLSLSQPERASFLYAELP